MEYELLQLHIIQMTRDPLSSLRLIKLLFDLPLMSIGQADLLLMSNDQTDKSVLLKL